MSKNKARCTKTLSALVNRMQIIVAQIGNISLFWSNPFLFWKSIFAGSGRKRV